MYPCLKFTTLFSTDSGRNTTSCQPGRAGIAGTRYWLGAMLCITPVERKSLSEKKARSHISVCRLSTWECSSQLGISYREA